MTFREGLIIVTALALGCSMTPYFSEGGRLMAALVGAPLFVYVAFTGDKK